MDWLNSDEWLAVGYGVAGVASIHTGFRERSRSTRNRLVCLWPTFWLLIAGLLFAFALGRALDIDELGAAFVRSQAHLAGWYRTRRALQASLVGSVSAMCIFVVFVAIRRVPKRLRRYVPMALVAFSMMCFAAIRLISLHHIDVLLHNRDIAGVRVVAVAEWSLITLAIVATYGHTLAKLRAVQTMPVKSMSPTSRSM